MSTSDSNVKRTLADVGYAGNKLLVELSLAEVKEICKRTFIPHSGKKELVKGR